MCRINKKKKNIKNNNKYSLILVVYNNIGGLMCYLLKGIFNKWFYYI